MILLQRVVISMLRFLRSRKRTAELQPALLRTILVVELTRLGDVVVILPFLNRLRDLFSRARVRVLVRQEYLSLLNAIESTAEFVGIDRPDTVLGLARAMRHVRGDPPDLVISASPPRRNAVVALASTSRFKLGYLSHRDSLTPFLESTPVESFGFLLPVPAAYAHENIYERPAKIFRGLGLDPGSTETRIVLKAGVYSTVKARMAGSGRIPRRPSVLLCPFSGWQYRDWPLENFFALADRINAELQCDVVLSVDAEDVPRLSRHPERSREFTLSTDLLETAVLMKDARLVVANDSGPLHLATALNTRAVGLFGPASPALTAPRSGGNTYLYTKLDCSPCTQRTCVRPDHCCMALHEVEDVFTAVARALHAPILERSLTANG